MSSSNHHQVSSPSHFQNLLSENLERVSVLSFWAPWAEPCKQMNVVITELAKKYPTILFLEIEAESQEDIAESFGIEAVPAFIILRGHTLLKRIDGADAPALTAVAAKFASPSSINPNPNPNPTPPSEQLDTRMHKLMNQSKVVLFMKGDPDIPRCGFSKQITGILNDHNVEYTHFDILSDDGIRQGLKVLNNWPTFPQLVVKGEFVGGLDIVKEMVESGEFEEVLA